MNNNTRIAIAVLVPAWFGLAGATVSVAEIDYREPSAGLEDLRRSPSSGELLQYLRSDCRRNGVIWSGGVARRGPDRISPRPVRSRWQRADRSRIRCSEGESFQRRRVADQPEIR